MTCLRRTLARARRRARRRVRARAEALLQDRAERARLSRPKVLRLLVEALAGIDPAAPPVEVLARLAAARDQAEMLWLLDELSYAAGPIPCPEWVDA